jgi:hypothetical protein
MAVAIEAATAFLQVSPMNLMRVIHELRRERDDIEEAIRSLERLAAATGPKRRGRPPKNAKALRIPRQTHSVSLAKGLRQPKAFVGGGVV